MPKPRVQLLLACAAIGFVVWIGWGYGSVLLWRGAATSRMPIPEDGTIADGRYTNSYFNLSYPLPQGLTAGLAGPEPSETGYYVLTSLVAPASDVGGTMLIAAQDMFFAPKQRGDAAAEAGDLREAMARVEGMSIDQEPSEVMVAGHRMQRVDFSGVGLYRATFTTEIRCHFVTFNLTARSPKLLAELASTLDQLSGAAAKGAPAPVCIKDYAVADNIVRRLEPAVADPRFVSIPVRIVIDPEGRVAHVHVIHATSEQRKSIEDALRQWKFRPPRVNGEAVAIETGLMFRFTGQVSN
jgi:hypothetical protein